MAERHGGKRAGAGRKPRADRFEKQIGAAERRIAQRLPELVDMQFALATGGAQRVEEKWAPAGTVVVDDIREDGESGKIAKFKRPAFPGHDPEELVLVERRVITLSGDARANEYLIDRILGKPAQAVEAEVSGPGGGAIPISIEAALAKVYGADEPDGAAGREVSGGGEDGGLS